MDGDSETGQVAFTMETRELRVVMADESHLDALGELIRAIEAKDHPDDSMGVDSALEGMRRSLRHFDALSSEYVWFLIAFYRDQPAGLAILTRIPKLDARLGFLYLNELHVIHVFRRHGIGEALLRRCIKLAEELGLAVIRLLARIDNKLARCLYESAGFRGSETMLYPFRFDHSDAQP